MGGVSHNIDRFGVVFDDESLVADAGLVAAATLMGRLGLVSLVDAAVRLGRRAGGAAPGRKVATLVAAMLVGATHIDHVDRLRAGATAAVLGFRPAAPSTVGSFLRSFTWGHVRQLDKAAGLVLGRAWATGGGPGNEPMTIDVDSTICAVTGATKAGAAYGHTQQLGYHPLVGVRAETGEIPATRLRKGSSQSGHVHLVAETVARARRAGAAGAPCARADSGFFSYDLLDRLDALGVRWSITIPQYGHAKATIARIPEADWAPIAYPDGGEAHVAETTLVAGERAKQRSVRLVARRSRLTDQTQAELWPHWRHHAFITNRTDPNTTAADKFHRQHATVELAIRDLKTSTGLAHLPSGSFAANAAWLTCAALPQQPLPLDQPPHHQPPQQPTHRRTNRPQPTPRPARAPRQPQRTHHLAPPRPMALGNHPPHRPHQHSRPPPTLLNPPITPTAAAPTGPTRPEPARPSPHAPQHHQTGPNKPIQTPQTARTMQQAPPTPPNQPPTTPIGGFRLRGHAAL